MNWDAIGALGESIGALAVVLTLGYLALQIRHARTAASDVNRLNRATGIRDWMQLIMTDNDLREAWQKTDGSVEHNERLAHELGVSPQEASKIVFGCQYWWWLHWGQWASVTTEQDNRELMHIVSEFYSGPPMLTVWKTSRYVHLLDPKFVAFVNSVIREPIDGTEFTHAP
jgi:hypothetical protein